MFIFIKVPKIYNCMFVPEKGWNSDYIHILLDELKIDSDAAISCSQCCVCYIFTWEHNARPSVGSNTLQQFLSFFSISDNK